MRWIIEDETVLGAVVQRGGEALSIRARAVVLAAGGVPNGPERRQAMFPRDASGHDNLALPPASCSGDGLLLWTLGCIAAYPAQSSGTPWLPLMLAPAMPVTTGLMTFILLIRDARNTYSLMRMTWQLQLRNKSYPDPRLEALKSLRKVYGFRYSVSAAIAVLFIFLGMR